jgi:TPR repeat protein
MAADQGHADAQFKLAICYQCGIGATKDEREAVKWYRLAADRGYTRAVDALRRLEV